MLTRRPLETSKAFIVAASFALGAAAMAAFVGHQTGDPKVSSRIAIHDSGSGWAEIKWPFPLDLWSSGKAFKCRSIHCGGELTLYLRAKIGFCNCVTGVADDAELERLSDVNLLGGKHSAVGPGRPITVWSMKGRSRVYAIEGTSPSGRSALVLAFNDRCDAIVGTVVFGHDRPAASEEAVMHFLNGDVVLKWVQVTLGL